MERLNEFRRFLQREGMRHSTIEHHCENIEYIARNTRLTKDGIEEYLFSLYEKGTAPSTLNKYISGVHNWGKFTGDKTLLEIERFKELPVHKSTLSEQELKDFLALPCAKGHPQKDYDIWNLYYDLDISTGGRGGEIATLTIDQIDFGRGVIQLDKTKTVPRDIAFPQRLTPILQNHIKSLIGENLFPKHFADHKIRNRNFQRRLKRLGIKRKGLSLHSLRHSFGTRMVTEISLPILQQQMGHKKLDTTAQYLHLTTKQIIESIKLDPMERMGLSYNERFKQAREELRKLLDAFTFSPDEELKMRKDLLNLL